MTRVDSPTRPARSLPQSASAPAARDVTAPAALEVTAPAALEVTAPAALEVTAPAALEVTAPAALEVTAPALEVTAPALDLKALFTAHYASVWRLLRRLRVRSSQLDDAAQEVFWVAARRLSDIRAGSERAFLYGVALRVAQHFVRRDGARAVETGADCAAELAAEDPDPEQRLVERRARELLDQVLDRLPLELSTVLVLFELEGLSLRDIAELEGLPQGTVASRLRRAREEFSAIAKRMRAALDARGAGR